MLVVEDEAGNIVREQPKDTEVRVRGGAYVTRWASSLEEGMTEPTLLLLSPCR